MAKQANLEFVAPPSYESSLDLPSSICCISLNESDKIRLIGAPEHLRASFREMLKRSWRKGIQVESDYCEQPEFKLLGNPWFGHGDDAVPCRTLLIEILRYMENQGWRYIVASDVSKKQSDKATLLFEYTGIVCTPTIFSLSFNRTDRLRVIGASPDIPGTVREAIRSYWVIQNEKFYHGSWEFKLAGNPWFADGDDAIRARMLLMKILGALRRIGYKLHASIEVCVGDSGYELDSWFLRKIDG
ncbi:hypothetical protein K7432_005951 [Basidiobolus ranarum]|uniref:Uncharacterized protein n=1 Tax=Basidiobolus ranarum TaxID=34480 RepID=A0ABR2WVS6_9FUNG